MALSKTLTIEVEKSTIYSGLHINRTKENLTLNDCYIKVEQVTGTKSKANALVSFTCGDFSYEKSYEFTPVMENINFIEQAYNYLKTTAEFERAANC